MKSQVLKVPAYTLHAYEAEVKLNQNENPYDFPGDLKEETFRRFRNRSWSRYPDFIPDSLRLRVAEFAGWQKDGVLIGNGSNELLQSALTVLIKSQTRVAIPAPTFTVYRLIVKVLGARIVDILLNPDLTYNVDDLIAKSRESGAGVLIINSPNNPTGSVLKNEDLKRILEQFSGHVLLDEAYYEFWGRSAMRVAQGFPQVDHHQDFLESDGDGQSESGILAGAPGPRRPDFEGEVAV